MNLVSILARNMPATLSSLHCIPAVSNDPLQSKMKIGVESIENSMHVFMKLAFLRPPHALVLGIVQHWTFL